MASNNPYEASMDLGTQANAATGRHSVLVKRVDPIALALMMGALYAVPGLVIGGFVSVAAIFGIAVDGQDAIGGVIGGIGAMLFLPILYGFIGLCFGLIVAIVYNLVAAVVGGIRLDLDVRG